MLRVITRNQRYLAICLAVILFLPSRAFSRGDLDLPKLSPPDEYGDVFIDRSSGSNKIMPVVFSHWVHRQKYTCRVCHVELNFSMKASDTGIACGKGEMTGKYCTVCHNNKTAFGTKGPEGEKNCDRCHNANASPNREKFAEMKRTLPSALFGNEIDWAKALTDGKIRPKSSLTNGTAYTFTVTATNSVGTGPASAASNSVTPPAVPSVPGAPTIGTATAGNTTATVSFTAPASNGGSAITLYRATSTPAGFTGTAAGPIASLITVTGLSNRTAYTFTVTATNAVGTGLASGASNSVTPSAAPTVPGAPTIVTAASNSVTPTAVPSVPGAPTIGTASAGSLTPAGVPGAPTIGTATAGNTIATVRFTAPASKGVSAITMYMATSNPGGFTGTVVGPKASPITVRGLANGTAYSFTVTPISAVGPGPASAASNSVTPATLPSAPTIGTATAGNATANVSFTAPSSNGGSAITVYTATSTPGGFTGTVAGPMASPITVTGMPVDYKPVILDRTLKLEAEMGGISAAVFPHKIHTEWLDCEMCHPDVFNIKKKTTKHFSMWRILNKEFCGVCHLNVAFPMNDCKRCHPGMKN